MNILIVDDEQVALTSVKRLLRRRGIRKIETCDNGYEAIKRIKEQDFDIVLLDLLIAYSEIFRHPIPKLSGTPFRSYPALFASKK